MPGGDAVKVGRADPATMKKVRQLIEDSSVMTARFTQPNDPGLVTEGGVSLRAHWKGRSVDLRTPVVGRADPNTKRVQRIMREVSKRLHDLLQPCLKKSTGAFMRVDSLGDMKEYRKSHSGDTTPLPSFASLNGLPKPLRTAMQTPGVYRGPFTNSKTPNGYIFLYKKRVYQVLVKQG